MITKNNRKFQDFSQRQLVEQRTTLAANAGATEIYNFPLKTNRKATFHGLVDAVAGVVGAAQAITVDATANTGTMGSPHGYVGSVVPGFISASVVPTGWSANTLYYAAIISTTAIKLYATAANALTNDGSTGLIDPTTTGTAVFFTPTVVNACYRIIGTAVNREGNVALVGTPSIVALEDVAAWDCTVTADNTNKTLQVKGTPDASMITRFRVSLQVFDESLDILA